MHAVIIKIQIIEFYKHLFEAGEFQISNQRDNSERKSKIIDRLKRKRKLLTTLNSKCIIQDSFIGQLRAERCNKINI